MIVGILQLDLRIPASRSLKDKRRVLRSIKDRARQKFNISISEVEYENAHQLGRLGVTTAANDKRFVESLLSQVVNFIGTVPGCAIVDEQIEIL